MQRAADQGRAQQAAHGDEDGDEGDDDDGGGMYSEEDIVLIMEFASLGRAAAIELLHDFGGNTEAVLANMFP
jgi:NACalpha-BTF3-like transcription factor